MGFKGGIHRRGLWKSRESAEPKGILDTRNRSCILPSRRIAAGLKRFSDGCKTRRVLSKPASTSAEPIARTPIWRANLAESSGFSNRKSGRFRTLGMSRLLELRPFPRNSGNKRTLPSGTILPAGTSKRMLFYGQ